MTSLLKDVYSKHFTIGIAQDRIPANLDHIIKHFNVITPENAAKWERIHPEPDRYNFEIVDRLVEDAAKHDMKVVGHTLVWHNQTPRWVFQDDRGQDVSADVLWGRLREHIETVVGRYEDKMYAWDVVNEALNEDGTLRDTPWKRILGDDYIGRVFEMTREVSAGTELYYNDYGLAGEAKVQGAVDLVQDLLDRGIPIDGVGFQGHFNIHEHSIDQVRRSLDKLASLGLKVMMTELDLSVFAFSDKGNHYTDGLPAEIDEQHAKRYAEFFQLFKEYEGVMDRVTFWGITDRDNWKNNFPVFGRTDYPLLFDREGKPKAAFDAVLDPEGFLAGR